MPDVSVVLPVRDRFEFLAEAVASVLDQDWEGSLEILVVEDGLDADPRDHLPHAPDNVRFLRQERAGVGAARALGIEQARAPLIAFQDDDDLWLPGKLALQRGVLERHPGVDMVFSDVVAFTPDGRRGAPYSSWWTDLRSCPHTVVAASEPPVLVFAPDALFCAFTGGMRLFHQSSLYRREYLLRIGGSDPRTPTCGDCIDLALRAAHGGRIAYVDAPTFELRRGHGPHLTGHPGWAQAEVREFLVVHEDYPEDLKRALEPWLGRYLTSMAWMAYHAGAWADAARLYDLVETYGALHLGGRVKRFFARRRAHRHGTPLPPDPGGSP